MTLREAMKLHGVAGVFGAVVIGPTGKRLVLRHVDSPDAPTDIVVRCFTNRGEQWLNLDHTEVLSEVWMARA